MAFLKTEISPTRGFFSVSSSEMLERGPERRSTSRQQRMFGRAPRAGAVTHLAHDARALLGERRRVVLGQAQLALPGDEHHKVDHRGGGKGGAGASACNVEGTGGALSSQLQKEPHDAKRQQGESTITNETSFLLPPY